MSLLSNYLWDKRRIPSGSLPIAVYQGAVCFEFFRHFTSLRVSTLFRVAGVGFSRNYGLCEGTGLYQAKWGSDGITSSFSQNLAVHTMFIQEQACSLNMPQEQACSLNMPMFPLVKPWQTFPLWDMTLRVSPDRTRSTFSLIGVTNSVLAISFLFQILLNSCFYFFISLIFSLILVFYPQFLHFSIFSDFLHYYC